MFRNIFVLSDVVGAVERLFFGVRDSDPLRPRPWTRFYEVGWERSEPGNP